MKTAVVTGAGKGIGFCVAEELIRREMYVWCLQRTISEENLKKLNDLANQNNSYVKVLHVDITDKENCKKAIKEIITECGGIDILINNAGISDISLFYMTSDKRLREVFETNFFSQIYLTQLVAKRMSREKTGTIVNVASSTGLRPDEGTLSYGASKAAMIYATGVMAKELGKDGIRVNAICPGFVDTDMWKDRTEEAVEKMLEKSPLRRMGKPEEIAKAICFLADDDSSYITGCILTADGGVKSI